MIDILYDYFETVMNRYSDRVDEWVVVNEPDLVGVQRED